MRKSPTDAPGTVLRDPRTDKGIALIQAINKQLTLLRDGPYIFFNGDTLTSYRFEGRKIQRGAVAASSRIDIPTDSLQQSFGVHLQPAVSAADIYPSVDKILALSDIEGNFSALRKLLQRNGVIDAQLKWIFGKGHLVFCGDMFDRGNQVTECLWLLYSLEAQAKRQGGAVHFILGNHEIMNLQGNHDYATPKYLNNAQLLNKTIKYLYNENSVLGRWLRTKNVVEKIGDLLFVHGGLSPQINNAVLSIADINQLARPNYANRREDYGDANTNLIMSEQYGPFWYRGYYTKKENPESAIDSILQKYKAKHIVTGHTIIADTISVLYDNKIINTDVKHAKGKAEALLIEGSRFYRVNDTGERFLLFDERAN